ncbi:hypothetical protein B0A49_01190 [Cryomyces minteri]|uniref:GST N-terminal domain-containing protein n=1 Tax=Cryomyces minteri TaxID=331657 RepID=A0A4U0XXR1_9PEZI|nr:hypothetical protein B0A49_01190 [Cryomyces minteri]
MANGHGIEKLDDSSSAADLSRQVTVQMSPEQYERLFFQPTPAKGDLAKRLGNPTLLGVCGFLVPFCTTMMCLLQWRGTGPASLTGISGSYYFFGGIAMNVAALCEFILGNTFPFALFMIYGVHWINLGYMQDPLHNIAGAYGAKGAESIGFNAGNGMYNVVMTLISFVFFLGSLRTNAPFCLAVFCLIFLFAFLAAATFATPYIATPADGEYVLLLLRIGVLHAHGTGPNPYKVAILLDALQIPYKVKLWEFGDAPNGVKGPAFLKINPNGRVPALEDPNTSVTSWESHACISYILRVYDTSNKFHPGQSTSEQEKVNYDSWTSFLLSTLGPMTGQTNWYRHYNSVTNDDALKRYEEQTYRCYGVLDGQLAKTAGKSVLESGYGAVDMHFYPWVAQHGFAGLDISKYSSLEKWLKSVAGKPEVKEAYKKIPRGEEA